MIARIDGAVRLQNQSDQLQLCEKDRAKLERLNKNLDQSISKNKLSSEELRDDLEDTIEDMNRILDTLDQKLKFSLHDETERMITRIINIKTDEVIKELPPEEMLDLAARIQKMVGLIINEKV